MKLLTGKTMLNHDGSTIHAYLHLTLDDNVDFKLGQHGSSLRVMGDVDGAFDSMFTGPGAVSLVITFSHEEKLS